MSKRVLKETDQTKRKNQSVESF
ncbi:MAG: polyketide synthase docking domain-containing protein [Alkalibacterium sp.]